MITAQPPRKPFDLKPLCPPPNAVRRLRLHFGMTLRELAGEVGLSIQHLSAFERKGKELDTEKQCRIADYFKLPLQKLLDPNLDPEKIFGQVSRNSLQSFKEYVNISLEGR